MYYKTYFKNGPTDANFKNFDQASIPQTIAGKFSLTVTSISPIERNSVLNPKGKFNGFEIKVATKLNKENFRKLTTESSFEETLAEINFLSAAINESNNINSTKTQIINNYSDIDSNKLNVILSIEGGHSLFNNIKCTHLHNPDSLTVREIQDVYNNIDSLKNIQNRIFFITLDHIWWNQISGHAKATFKPGFKRVFLTAAASVSGMNKKLFNKHGSGIYDITYQKFCRNEIAYDNLKVDSIRANRLGANVIYNLLDTNNKWQKPIYIDLRHADIKSRLQYYHILDSLNKIRKHIPIIFSHAAVSGENLKVAHYTGLGGLYDRYGEINRPYRFFLKRKNYVCSHKVSGRKNYGLQRDFPDVFDTFYDDTTICNSSKCNRNHRHDISKDSLGWFFSWGVNLYNEEIKHIYDNKGMIGLMCEERLLGAYMKQYKRGKYSNSKTIIKLKKQFDYSKDKRDSFIEIAPFLRNLFHIVKYSGKSKKEAWKSVCFSSDFDGLTDPIDICKTASDVPNFKRYLLSDSIIRKYCIIYDLNYDDYFDSEFTEQMALDMFFQTNLRNFIEIYF